MKISLINQCSFPIYILVDKYFCSCYLSKWKFISHGNLELKTFEDFRG